MENKEQDSLPIVYDLTDGHATIFVGATTREAAMEFLRELDHGSYENYAPVERKLSDLTSIFIREGMGR